MVHVADNRHYSYLCALLHRIHNTPTYYIKLKSILAFLQKSHLHNKHLKTTLKIKNPSIVYLLQAVFYNIDQYVQGDTLDNQCQYPDRN